MKKSTTNAIVRYTTTAITAGVILMGEKALLDVAAKHSTAVLVGACVGVTVTNLVLVDAVRDSVLTNAAFEASLL